MISTEPLPRVSVLISVYNDADYLVLALQSLLEQTVSDFEIDTHGGPGIFLTRLKAIFETQGIFSTDSPDIWLQLSHKPSPEFVISSSSQTKLLVRTAGGYYYRFYAINRPFVAPMPFVDNLISARKNRKLNRTIADNLSRADQIIFQSHFARTMTQHFIANRAQGDVILNGVDTALFVPGNRKNASIVNILVSHQFRLHKRLHEVIRVVARLNSLVPNSMFLHLHIVGGGSEDAFQAAKSVIQQKKLGNQVTFWGNVNHQDLPRLYQQCDFMIALPLWDPCPNVVVEALSCGLPVLTTSAGGIPELMGQAGHVIEEPLPMTFMDHHHLNRIPRVNVEPCAQAALNIIENLSDYQALARERALTALDIHLTARNYATSAEKLVTLLDGRESAPSTSPLIMG